tara:strand:+ start:911 stop:1084 length:174 start_codon:yes stop_codon:yes gene_type:complete
MKKYNGALIIIALAFFIAMLLSIYNENFNWKIDVLGPIVLIAIVYGGISYEKNKNKE